MSINLGPKTGSKTVTTAGTAEALSSTTMIVSLVDIVAKKATGDNTGSVYIGDSTVDKDSNQTIELVPGGTFDTRSMAGGHQIDLSKLYIDADNNGDGVTWIAWV